MTGSNRAVPSKPSLDGLEDKHSAIWETTGIYRFDRAEALARPRHKIFSIDTPPPTASGSLHIGHIYSFTHTDIVARFHRMRGRTVFYPMGWDDNGLPTERRVQNYFHVRCDPGLTTETETTFEQADRTRREQPPTRVSRRTFISLCERLTRLDEQAFEELWRRLGLSVDWSRTYTTIGRHSRQISQRAFLLGLAAGEIYHDEAPTAWDVDFQTAVAQAEQEDREVAAAYHQLIFKSATGTDLAVDTTRPELLPACVALVAHPDDERYRELFGTSAITPLFGTAVPIHPHHLADPSKGTGLVMVCTFGDQTDVVWQRDLGLPIRAIIGRDGRLLDLDASTRSAWGMTTDAYEQLAGLTTTQARREIVARLGLEPRPMKHVVKFYEKGERPLEIVTSRQWFIRTLLHREQLLEAGRQIRWQPEYMQRRYEDWVGGLTSDWLISRQRYFGVPFPVWYPLDADGAPDFTKPILPTDAALPVDPQSQAPEGYDEAERGRPGGFIGDPDVMDTWATSSLTPQIVAGWTHDDELWRAIYPMDLRPQAHDIIRTWLFGALTRAAQLDGTVPWRAAAISGFITDPDRKKMSKSFSNAVTPMQHLQEYGSDAVRYWAACGRPGADTAFDANRMRVGRRLAMKILNVSRFVLSFPPTSDAPSADVDLAMLASLDQVVIAATEALEALDYARAIEQIETFFWTFCDDYVELVKTRAYESSQSAIAALTIGLDTLVRLLAPFLPYATDEVWSWWQAGSVHRAAWPEPANHGGDPTLFDAATSVLGAIRRAKAAANLSMRTDCEKVIIPADTPGVGRLAELLDDLLEVAHTGAIATG